ncbi:predicted protein [Naegleria gruberi]|uniref:Predicted protein n=1 Tax=Naegleria gruberi TaxID=5762 RepID=D2V2X9_NAEGR|nr:uncharacterized protein NAEGRDRAFT_63155 [Naegleria gruberi]EFC49140.1 predicted protein [Naegleria gruberi]|eukprot:XP_002681884.1 predicted protein [Naegleria gruberi strain NEG-M]
MSSSGCVALDVMAFWNYNIANLMKDSNIHRTLSIPKKLANGELLNAESILGSVQWNPIKTTIISAKSFKYYALLVSDLEDDIISWEKEFTKNMKQEIQEMKSMNIESDSTPRNVSLFFNCQYSLSEDITETFVSVGPMFLISFSITLGMVVATLVFMRGERSDSIIMRILVGFISIILISLDIFSSFGIANILCNCNLNPLSAQALPLFLVGIGSDGLFILQAYFNRYREYLKELKPIEENVTNFGKFVKNSSKYYREVLSALIFTLTVMCCILLFVVFVMKHPISMAIRYVVRFHKVHYVSVAWQTLFSVVFLFFTAIFGITPLLVLEYKFNTRNIQLIYATIPETDQNINTNQRTNEEEELSNLENVPPQNEEILQHLSSQLETEQAITEQKGEIPRSKVEKIMYSIFKIVFEKPKYFSSHILIILISLGLLICSVVVIATIDEEPFAMTDLYAKSSQLTSFLDNYHAHHGDLEYPGYLVMYVRENSTDQIDFSSTSMANLLEKIIESPPPFMKTQINWFSYFKTWTFFISTHRDEYKANKFKIPPQLFNEWMDEFTQHHTFSNLASFVISKPLLKDVKAARIVFSNKNVLNSQVTNEIVQENAAFMKQIASDYPAIGLTSSNSFIVNDMDLIFESFGSDPLNVGIISALAILSVAIISTLVTSLFEIPMIKKGKLSLFISIIICSILTCFLTLINVLELIAGLRLLGIPINGLSIMNFTLQIGLFSEYLFQITRAFLLTKRTKKTYTLLAFPLLICSLSTIVSIFPLAFHEIRMVKKYFFDIVILGQGILLFNVLSLFPAILLLIERFMGTCTSNS